MAAASLFVLFVAVAVAAQSGTPPVPTNPRAPQGDVTSAKDEAALTIVGCVRGSRLKPSSSGASDAVTNTLRATEYLLDGPKDVLKNLTKHHDGHLERITGVVKIPPSPGQPDVHVRTKDLGEKTRVTIGNRVGTASSVDSPPPSPPTILVQSFSHLADKCAAR